MSARRSCVLLLGAIGSASASDNGRARQPPMGWRDWNQYQGDINQELMELAFRGLADTSFGTVNGKPMSLAQVGYNDAGLDDVWQKCGSYGPQNYTYHDAAGNPVVDTEKFPDMKAMVDVAHSLGLTAGWYGNNCACHDHCTSVECFAGDINATLAFGYDSIKLDGCGQEEDVALWSEMFNHSIRLLGSNHSGMMIENCHNGGPAGNTPHYDEKGELQCPYHTYRSSTDIRPVYGSILVNLMSVPPLAEKNLSVPGCWAYPGMNFSDTQNLKKHWETITNLDAIEVNQDYAGFSGSMFYNSTETEQFKPCSWWARDDCKFPVAMSWYKPLSGRDARKSTMAVLLMNNGAASADLSFKLSDVPGLHSTGGCTAYSVWEGKSLGQVTADGGFAAKAVGSRDSVFLTLSGCQ